MKHEILVYNKTRKRVPEKFMKTVVLNALDLLKLKRPVELAVLVVDKEEIKRLNKIWRKANETPNELSFGLNSRQMVVFAKGDVSVLNLGEIVLNVDKISNKNYLSELLIHSLLHLLGYSHKRMGSLENKVIKN